MRALLLLVAGALVLAGCTNSAQPPQTVEPTSGGPDGSGNTTAGNNTTAAFKPPVARMQVFDAGGALVFESNFVADNTSAATPVKGGAAITFLASLSEAVDKTASLVRWDWSFGDGGTASGRGVSHTFTDVGGIFPVTLTVTDSHGLSDPLVVTVGVRASRVVNESLSFQGAIQIGTLGNVDQDGLDAASHKLELKDDLDGQPVLVQSLRLNLSTTDPLSDFDLYLLDAEGEVVGQSAHNPNPGEGEVLRLSADAVHNGTYTVHVVLFLGAQGTYKVTGEVFYQLVNPQVEARFGGGH